MFELPKIEKTKNFLESGQTLLLVLLSLAVVLIIILSILSRSVTDVTISTREEDALRAFSAAEAGIERALIIGGDASGVLENASFEALVSELGTGSREFSSPVKVNSGETATIWFVDHDPSTGELTCSTGNCFTGTTATFCWGEEDTPSNQSTTPALEVSIFYAETPGDYSTIKIARGAYDSYQSRTPPNNFIDTDPGGCSTDGKAYAFQKNIVFSDFGIPATSYDFQNGLQFARLRLLYNTNKSQPVGIDVTAPDNSMLPSQGMRITSSGSFGEANRRLEVFQTYGELPPVFDQVIFSPGGIVR